VSRKVKSQGTTSRFKGVCWDKRSCRWRVTIVNNYKQVHVGTFDSEEDAGRAYDLKAIELFGVEFSRLNFPLEPNGHDHR